VRVARSGEKERGKGTERKSGSFSLIFSPLEGHQKRREKEPLISFEGIKSPSPAQAINQSEKRRKEDRRQGEQECSISEERDPKKKGLVGRRRKFSEGLPNQG